jgi:prolyl-tRNA synthetase
VLQGVPLRLEIGPNDLSKQQTLSVRRDNGVKNPIALADIGSTVSSLLITIQDDMFNRAKETYQSRVKEITHWDDVVPNLDNKNIVVIPWCDEEACEDDIKERSGRTYVFDLI